ncbi:MAG: NAD(P)-binding domain-containing protein, partial [Cryobacterium sp.]
MPTLAFIGADAIGSQLARLAVAHGYDVVLSDSRGPGALAELLAQLGSRARATTVLEAANAADVVVIDTPLADVADLPAEALEGKVVIDTDNYYPERDGQIPELDDETATVSERLQVFLTGSLVVKAFNHLPPEALTTDARAAGAPDRRALIVAGNDADARDTVSALITDFGFDVIDLGPLAEGWRIQRDTPGFGLSL